MTFAVRRSKVTLEVGPWTSRQEPTEEEQHMLLSMKRSLVRLPPSVHEQQHGPAPAGEERRGGHEWERNPSNLNSMQRVAIDSRPLEEAAGWRRTLEFASRLSSLRA